MSRPLLRRPAFASVSALALVGVVGCEPPTETPDPTNTDPVAISIPFVGVVGDDVFACGTSYALGSAGASALVTDFRFYLHDIAVIDDAGTAHALTLDDGDFQANGHALIDFEDGTGACQTGSPTRHSVVTGTLEKDVTITGVTFKVGVAAEQNQLDVSSADAPLNVPGLYWSWANGYKHMRADLAVGDAEAAARFHLGANACAGDPGAIACGHDNTPTIALDLDPSTDAIAVDLAALYASVDLEAANAEGDGVKGCMSGLADPECPGMFGALGLGLGDDAAVTADPAFVVRTDGRADAEALED